jgi:hypothetical protein
VEWSYPARFIGNSFAEDKNPDITRDMKANQYD